MTIGISGCAQGLPPALIACSLWPRLSRLGSLQVNSSYNRQRVPIPITSRRIASALAPIRNYTLMASAAAGSGQDELLSGSNVVTVRYGDLLDKNSNLDEVLEEGFGPSGLGIIAVSGVPMFPDLRKKLLQLSQSLSSLPEEAKLQLEDPTSKYSFGWSHGKEILESGRPDSLKGSFYANPLHDVPTLDSEMIQRYPTYCRPNLWPTNHLPELEPAFKMLGGLMVEVGLLISYHCDKYISSRSHAFKETSLERILQRSFTHKGRLLHYFSSDSSSSAEMQDPWMSWCGWHTDHSCLTALTCAMYVKEGVEIPCPDPEAGLYIRTQSGATVKAVYDTDAIAYQMGEATEILFDGLLHATPHFVRAAQGEIASGVERNTFAVFMQPHWDEPLKFLESHSNHETTYDSTTESTKNQIVGITDSARIFTFGEFSEERISKYY